MSNPDIGKRLKIMRKNAGFSQKELAQELGVKQSTISRWENNIDHPSLLRFTKLISVLRCKYEDILGSQSC